MFVTIITDCRDANTTGRQATRLATLFPQTQITMAGIADFTEIEAAGNLIDMLDASEGEEGVILVNSAPRQKKKWPNGTPFGYFWYKKTLVVATIDGLALSLAKKLGLATEILVTDIPTVTESLVKKRIIIPDLAHQLVHTQFRSFDYMPRLAKWVMDGISIPSKVYNFTEVEDIGKSIWWIDNFGNAKTTVLPEEIGFEAGKKIMTKIGELTCYTRMKDVAVGTPAIIVGSSGVEGKRFVEIIVLGQRASDTFNLHVGQEIF